MYCSECGGINALGRVAVKIDCTTCDTTGYENYWTTYSIYGIYRPSAPRRWDAVAGQVVYKGDASIKISEADKPLLDRATHLEFNGVQWDFSMERDAGTALGQTRYIYNVTRKV